MLTDFTHKTEFDYIPNPKIWKCMYYFVSADCG